MSRIFLVLFLICAAFVCSDWKIIYQHDAPKDNIYYEAGDLVFDKQNNPYIVASWVEYHSIPPSKYGVKIINPTTGEEIMNNGSIGIPYHQPNRYNMYDTYSNFGLRSTFDVIEFREAPKFDVKETYEIPNDFEVLSTMWMDKDASTTFFSTEYDNQYSYQGGHCGLYAFTLGGSDLVMIYNFTSDDSEIGLAGMDIFLPNSGVPTVGFVRNHRMEDVLVILSYHDKDMKSYTITEYGKGGNDVRFDNSGNYLLDCPMGQRSCNLFQKVSGNWTAFPQVIDYFHSGNEQCQPFKISKLEDADNVFVSSMDCWDASKNKYWKLVVMDVEKRQVLTEMKFDEGKETDLFDSKFDRSGTLYAQSTSIDEGSFINFFQISYEHGKATITSLMDSGKTELGMPNVDFLTDEKNGKMYFLAASGDSEVQGKLILYQKDL